ncbi:hypothetical protein OV203_19205 [Nannocystis sp. ILAH1]|uniref:hypothetical protein n=1 Tax=unclassified Nannocystis TaxID=2627009 RepID=UPI00226F9E83|nr:MULTISPECIES: hypothetical protein [unclassified Nannocystis]MCY0989275.1 hypothetical protein [Nannocystis sp. ILAH1]MCY1065030.1 hypothetical protein [Nannocystis sp. RBIL2]
MNDSSRSAFEAELRRLGYGQLDSFDSDPCVHQDADECAVFVMPTRECKDAATYGQLGWLVYEGCRDCCEACTRTLNCGGMFTHLRVFAGGVLTERFDDDEIRPAAAPVDDDE